MINISTTKVYGFEAAIRGMRNPMNSWDKSDSTQRFWKQELGQNDLQLAISLVLAGTDHSKFMRMINVSMDITAPLYWWKEFDTYKVGTVANSCSTMHKIHEKEFVSDDFSYEHLFDSGDGSLQLMELDCTQKLLVLLNAARESYLKTKDKRYWWVMIQMLPSSYNQKRTISTNYAVLRNMYHARKQHKLDEWRNLCQWIESLPYSELITKTVDEK